MFRFLTDLTVKSTLVSLVLFFLIYFGLSFSEMENGVAFLFAMMAIKGLGIFISGGTALYMVMRD